MTKFNPPDLSHERPRRQQPRRATVPSGKATGTNKQVGRKPAEQQTPWQRQTGRHS